MIRLTKCASCGKPLTGRRRQYCSARCGSRRRVRVHRGAELSTSILYDVVDLDAGHDRGGAQAFGVRCDYEVAEIFAEDSERWRHLGIRQFRVP